MTRAPRAARPDGEAAAHALMRLGMVCCLGLVLAVALWTSAASNPRAAQPEGVPADALVLLAYVGTPRDALATGAVCSGALVGSGVLTAAHCLQGGPVQAVVGVADMCDPQGAQVVPLGDPIPLPAPSASLDLALLPLAGQLDTKPPGVRPAPDGGLVALGFGGTGTDGVRACAEHRVALSVDEPSACTELLAAAGASDTTSARVLCARGVGDDTCGGDSGGPVVDDQGQVLAVTSFGRDCTGAVPGVYVRLAGLTGWLAQVR